MKNRVRVSVIIPTYNRNQVLVDSIKSVLDQRFKEYELIVVDQSRKHDSKTAAFLQQIVSEKRTLPDIGYYRVTPPSLPAARNFGLNKAKGSIVIYIDDDVVLEPGFIKAHLESYKSKDIVSVAGRIVQKDKPVSDTLLYIRKTSFGAGNFNYPRYAYAETAQGCNMSYRKKILLKIGGFDTNFIGNAVREESDVSFKLRKMGYKILYNPKASLFHLFYQSGGCREGSSIHDNYIIYRNEMLFFLRHRPLIYLPYFIGGHIINFVINKKLFQRRKVLKRLAVFIRGLAAGFFVYLFPRRYISAREVNF